MTEDLGCLRKCGVVEGETAVGGYKGKATEEARARKAVSLKAWEILPDSVCEIKKVSLTSLQLHVCVG